MDGDTCKPGIRIHRDNLNGCVIEPLEDEHIHSMTARYANAPANSVIIAKLEQYLGKIPCPP